MDRLAEIKGDWTQNRQEWWERRAHQDVPWLIHEVDRLREHIAGVEAQMYSDPHVTESA